MDRPKQRRMEIEETKSNAGDETKEPAEGVDSLGRPNMAPYWKIGFNDLLSPDMSGFGAILNAVLRSLRPSIVQVPTTEDSVETLFSPGLYQNDHFIEVQWVVRLLFENFEGIDPILTPDNWNAFPLRAYLHLAYFINEPRNIFRIKSEENQKKKDFDLEKYRSGQEAAPIEDYKKRKICFMYVNNASETERLKKLEKLEKARETRESKDMFASGPQEKYPPLKEFLVASPYTTVEESVLNLVMEMSKFWDKDEYQFTAHVGVKLCKLLGAAYTPKDPVTERWKQYLNSINEKDRKQEIEIFSPMVYPEVADPALEDNQFAIEIRNSLKKSGTPLDTSVNTMMEEDQSGLGSIKTKLNFDEDT